MRSERLLCVGVFVGEVSPEAFPQDCLRYFSSVIMSHHHIVPDTGTAPASLPDRVGLLGSCLLQQPPLPPTRGAHTPSSTAVGLGQC